MACRINPDDCPKWVGNPISEQRERHSVSLHYISGQGLNTFPVITEPPSSMWACARQLSDGEHDIILWSNADSHTIRCNCLSLHIAKSPPNVSGCTVPNDFPLYIHLTVDREECYLHQTLISEFHSTAPERTCVWDRFHELEILHTSIPYHFHMTNGVLFSDIRRLIRHAESLHK